MGYYMSLQDSSFEIKKNKISSAAKAIRSLDDGTRYSWVDNGFSKAKSIEVLFAAWRFECERDANGDILYMVWDGEKSGDERVLFNAIAPYVEKGSFLEWHGEDGEMWRWIFDGKQMKEIKPKITWNEEE